MPLQLNNTQKRIKRIVELLRIDNRSRSLRTRNMRILKLRPCTDQNKSHSKMRKKLLNKMKSRRLLIQSLRLNKKMKR
jgi:hypothetical protein